VYKGRVIATNTVAWTFVLRSDDSGAIRIPGQVWTTSYAGVIDIRSPDTLYRERGAGELRGVITLPAGQHDIEILSYERSGGAGHELYARRACTTRTPTPPPGVWWDTDPAATCRCPASGRRTAPIGWCGSPRRVAIRPSPT
jgi:hypothetical protein